MTTFLLLFFKPSLVFFFTFLITIQAKMVNFAQIMGLPHKQANRNIKKIQ